MEISAYSGIIVFVLVLAACLLCLFLGLSIGLRQGRAREDAEWRGRKLESIVKARLKQSRAVLGGQSSEQIAPLIPDFPYDPGDCRFVGKPVDFIVFRGMNQRQIAEVIFLEVKSGAARNLNERERTLRDLIRAGKVRWEEFDVPPGGKPLKMLK
jgi:predicted Holliday junction resolvase-like endonuclease